MPEDFFRILQLHQLLHKHSDETYELFDYKTEPRLATQEDLDNENARGQAVRILNLGTKKAGEYVIKVKAVKWDGRDDLGEW